MKRMLLLAVLSSGFAAHATDGVIEINAAKVVAAGGYPYVINLRGSYRLTGNLKQDNPTVAPAIWVQADDVTLDLNGFAVTGNNVCSATGTAPNQLLSCKMSPAGYPAIMATAASGGAASPTRVTVKNGSVSGIAGGCIYLGYDTLNNVSAGTVVNVEASHCGNGGINAAKVTNSKVTYSQGGIEARDVLDNTVSYCVSPVQASGGVVSRNSVEFNFNSDPSASTYALEAVSAVVSGNTVSNNQSMGLGVGGTSTVIGNTLANNLGVGLDAEQGNVRYSYGPSVVIYTQNVLYGNNNNSPLPAEQISGGPISIPAGSNWCRSAVCP